MTQDSSNIKAYWDDEKVQSLEDQHLLNAEIELIKRWIPQGSKILDAGCGEGIGTLVYADGARQLDAVDFSATRLDMARKRLDGWNNVTFKQVDFLGKDPMLDHDYDVVISQRLLINLPSWEQQSNILSYFMSLLKRNGRLLLLEGSQDGVAQLNLLRELLDLSPIPVRWHNLFLDDLKLQRLMVNHRLIEKSGFGGYWLLTRGIRPYFDKEPHWDCEFNKKAISPDVLGLFDRLGFSRTKFWVYQR
jgi:ubiquinone/menaquinone biosynthesis C-methylase UbiE